MKNRRVAMGTIVAAFLGASLAAACGSDSIVGQDCSVKCDNVRNDCTKKCNDDGCRTQCTTNFNDCKASCEKVTVMTDGG